MRYAPTVGLAISLHGPISTIMLPSGSRCPIRDPDRFLSVN
jgi:hypothetical protein